jgi:hypothetical protein
MCDRTFGRLKNYNTVALFKLLMALIVFKNGFKSSFYTVSICQFFVSSFVRIVRLLISILVISVIG